MGYWSFLKLPVPFWFWIVGFSLGMFLGTWQQAVFMSQEYGLPMSWRSHAVFLAPMLALWVWAVFKARSFKKEVKGVGE